MTRVSASTIPYQLRPHKAIERNLFMSLLKKLDRANEVDLEKYRYVGFGAAFLEDFKSLHSEFNINRMDCIEIDEFAYSRQKFNNPYKFIKLFNTSSTEYINSPNFKRDINQIIWWDYAMPRQLRQSLQDIELTGQKVQNLDIIKFTFNSSLTAFIETHNKEAKRKNIDMKPDKMILHNQVLKFFETDDTLKKYLPETIKDEDIKKDFSEIVRAFSLRAIRRGMSKLNNENLDFFHLSSFKYADGQQMTTVTGIVCEKNKFSQIIKESGLNKWDFYTPDTSDELIPAAEILVPAMTISERAEIDKRLHKKMSPKDLADKIKFKYGTEEDEHERLIEGYCRYYRYLPHYSKITI